MFGNQRHIAKILFITFFGLAKKQGFCQGLVVYPKHNVVNGVGYSYKKIYKWSSEYNEKNQQKCIYWVNENLVRDGIFMGIMGTKKITPLGSKIPKGKTIKQEGYNDCRNYEHC